MGFFDDEDVSEISDNPFALPDDTYICLIIEAVNKATNVDPTGIKTPKTGLNMKYQIEEGPYRKQTLTEWMRTPDKMDADFAGMATKQEIEDDSATVEGIEKRVKYYKALSVLKKHFLSYGFGADELGNLKEDGSDLIGKRVKVRTRTVTDDNKDTRVKIVGTYICDEIGDTDVDFGEWAVDADALDQSDITTDEVPF
jgi:hypothetical protein